MADKEETIENRISKMEEIAKALANPETDLQQAITLYEEGMKIAKTLDEELSNIERRIEIVTSKPGEDPSGVITEPFPDPSK